MIQAVLMQGRVAHASSSGIKQADQNHCEGLSTAPDPGMAALEMARKVRGPCIMNPAELTMQRQLHSELGIGEKGFHFTSCASLDPFRTHRQRLGCCLRSKQEASALVYV